jgi:nucleotide-binding universal stress UspA family protein
MKPFTTVVAIDFSTSSDAAVDVAFDLAASKGPVHLHLLAVQELVAELLPSPHEELRSPIAPLHELAERAVGRFEARQPASRIEAVVLHSMLGDPAQEIVALAAALDADLIVVGTHGRRGVARAFHGSVAEKVIRTAGCPVHVVREKHHAEALKIPEVEPVCPECAGTRKSSGGREIWCSRHAEHHVHKHIYTYGTRGEGGARPWGFAT